MTTYFKVFFSKFEECKWLNSMGEKGFLLNKKSFCRYYFTKDENKKYYYSVEYLDYPVKSQQGEEELNNREANGINYLFTRGKWSYFYSTIKSISLTSASKKKIADLYLWKSLYLLFFSGFSWILWGYQKFAVDYIVRYGHIGDGQFDMLKLEGGGFLDSLKTFWNGVLVLLNNSYFKIFTSIFGENSVALVMAFLIPVAIVLTILFALNVIEFVFWQFMSGRKSTKSSKKR
ncbi:MAG: DUF2812 domain-containing protein [Ruminococcaceae bacterium]|nr:DUF2812 domain-containing protein [Oscillospiraceae bacterium]